MIAAGVKRFTTSTPGGCRPNWWFRHEIPEQQRSSSCSRDRRVGRPAIGLPRRRQASSHVPRGQSHRTPQRTITAPVVARRLCRAHGRGRLAQVRCRIEAPPRRAERRAPGTATSHLARASPPSPVVQRASILEQALYVRRRSTTDPGACQLALFNGPPWGYRGANPCVGRGNCPSVANPPSSGQR